MRWALLALLAVPCAAQQQQATPKGPFEAHGAEVFSLPNPKDCGLITRMSPSLIPPGCLQSVRNVYFDQDWSILRRNGYSAYNLTACTGGNTIKGLWPYYGTNGIQYLVAFSSNSMYYSTGQGECSVLNPSAGGATWNLTPSAEMQCATGMGKLVCTDGSDPVFETDILSSNTISGAPQGTLISFSRNRFWIAGVSGNLTQLYGSGQYNETDWALNLYPNLSTSPVQINISGANDGQRITCLMGQFQNQFYVGRNYDLYALAGYDNRDFTLRKVSEEVGCIEPKSIQEVNNVLYWISKRGVEGLTGTQITPVSYPIDPTIKQIIAATGNTRSQLLTSPADWNSGNTTASGGGAPVSTTISPGDVVPSSFSIVNVTTSDFATGSINSSGTGVMAGGGIAPGGTATKFDIMYEARNGILPENYTPTWTASNNGGGGTADSMSNGILNLQVGSPSLGLANRFIAEQYPLTIGTTANALVVVNVGANITPQGFAQVGLADYSKYNGNTGGYTTGGFTAVQISTEGARYGTTGVADGSPLVGYSTFTILITTHTAGDNFLVRFWKNGTYEGTMIATQPITTLLMYVSNGGNASLNTSILNVQNFYYAYGVADPGPVNIPTISTFTSQILNTTFSTPTASAMVVSSAVPVGTTASYAVRSSTSPNNDKWTAWESVLNGNNPQTMVRQYWQYMATFTAVNLATAPFVASVNLSAKTTGYYITPCILVSTPTSWGTIQVNAETNGGSFTFWTSTGPTCGLATATNATWTPQSPNAQISVTTTTTYIAERVLLSFPSSATLPVPTLNDMTFNWNTSSNRPPVASAEYSDRYYIFYTTNSVGTPHNDHALVYDYNQKWTLLDDVNAYSATKYLNQIFLGDSNTTGTIYQAETGNSDNGSAFTMAFQTGDLDMGDPAQVKTFQWAYLMTSGPQAAAQSISISCSYNLDGSSTTYSLGATNLAEAPEQSGYYVAKMPFPVGQPSSGHWVSVACSYTGTDGPVRVYGLKVAYTRLRWD